ncbi:MAG: hypothetical protein VST67_11575 [Nitrospirota bacterium]|nr:hypothetical protein [Nitrospirota bacterium]
MREPLPQTMARVLRPKGFVFMVNCGEEKANACRLMAGADLKLVGQLTCPDPFTEWKELPIVSLWEKG